MRKITKTILLCFFTLPAVCGNLFALDFQIDRAKVRIKMPAGWSDGSVINVENRDKEPVKIRVYIGDWVYSDQDGAKDFLPSATHPRSCADWIKFYPTDFIIAGGKKQKLNYVIAIPPGAIGGHYAVLFFEVQAGTVWDEQKGVMVKVYNRLASLFYVEPEGTIKREAKLSGFSVTESPSAIKIDAALENTGNVDIASKGSFDIIDQEGFVFARGQFNETYTMPQDKAELSAQGSISGLKPGKYDVILTFNLGESSILVKEYQIEVSNSGKITAVKELG